MFNLCRHVYYRIHCRLWLANHGLVYYTPADVVTQLVNAVGSSRVRQNLGGVRLVNLSVNYRGDVELVSINRLRLEYILRVTRLDSLRRLLAEYV